MKASINTPQHLEPQANYLQQDLPRGVESVREAESQTCARVSVVDMLVSALCPCVSVAQAASSLGLSYLGTLGGFAALYLVGLLDFIVLYYTIGPAYKLGVQTFATFVGLEILMFMFGPVLSVFVAVLFNDSVNGDIDTNLTYVFITCLAWDIIFALASQLLVRNKLRRRVGLPRDGIFRLLFSSLCCLWFNTATTATSAKKYKPVSSCHLGALDAIPAYDPSERSVVHKSTSHSTSTDTTTTMGKKQQNKQQQQQEQKPAPEKKGQAQQQQQKQAPAKEAPVQQDTKKSGKKGGKK
ncbi:hypothetical protein Poli38472_009501 [Pythium oligandrum]|uniref:Uncharacterized protein n=1 Tax=Pythium oligandrum TaxID=41045 RepID=A0A8K1FKS7_PYTOL|nr:hypothetical protein Poli38472_009501 [Pythium oligandrum]|eukprot:TMW62008.1 hypothetical protein Poli38472_009501 [Pythium oligandrum]